MDERKSKIFQKLIDNQKSYATLVGSAGRAWLSGPDPSKNFEPWGLGSAGCLDFGWAPIGITDW